MGQILKRQIILFRVAGIAVDKRFCRDFDLNRVHDVVLYSLHLRMIYRLITQPHKDSRPFLRRGAIF